MQHFLRRINSSSRLLFFNSLRSFSTINSINSSKDYYKTLGLTNKASSTDVKKSFYSLAKKYHPDVSKGSEEKFKEINEAYEILGDENKRKEYDELRRVTQNEGNAQRQNPYYSQNSYGNPYNYNNNYNNSNQQYYYHYEVKNNKGTTYKKDFKQESPFKRHQHQRRDMGVNEEIIQEFMKMFYEGKMNQNQQAQYQRSRMNYSTHENQARNDDFMRQQGFRRDPFADDYEDYKTYESKRAEELKRQREFEKMQKEKQEKFVRDVQQGYEHVKRKYGEVSNHVMDFAEQAKGFLKKLFRDGKNK